MKTQEQRNKRELEEKLTLLENNNYPNTLGRIMLIDALGILQNYNENDFENQINRYLKLERKYK